MPIEVSCCCFTLLSPVQLILNTAEGSHDDVGDIKPHEVCPWSVDAIQGSQKSCRRSIPFPHSSTTTTITTTTITCSDTSDVNLPPIIYGKVCTLHMLSSLQDTHSSYDAPVLSWAQSSLAMPRSVEPPSSLVSFKLSPHFWKWFTVVMCGAALILMWNVVHHCCIMKQFVINHRKHFSYKVLPVVMFEWSDCSLIKCLENARAVWGKNPTLHSLGNLYLGDEQHTGPWKVRSSHFGISCP